MKITNLVLNRTQRLDNLDHGLNVVFHPDDDTIRSVHEAINQVFFAEPSPSGETAAVQIVDSGKTLQLRRGTESDGRRVVATELTAVDAQGRAISESTPVAPDSDYDDLSATDVRQLDQQLGTPASRAAYHPEFGSRTSFDQLVELARETSASTENHTLQAMLAELELQDRWTPSARYRELEERRKTLHTEISDLKHRLAGVDYENAESVNRLRIRISNADQRLNEMEARREALINELRSQESHLVRAETTSSASSTDLVRQRELLQSQIERVRAVVRDIDSRIDRHRTQPVVDEQQTRHSYLPPELEKRLRHLAGSLESAIQRLTRYAAEKHCVCRDETDRVAEKFTALAKCLDDIGGSRKTQVVPREIASHEQQRLEACRRQLNDHLQQLVQQRIDIDEQIATSTTSGSEVEVIRTRIGELTLALSELDRTMDEAEAALTLDRERLDQLAFHRDDSERLEARLRSAERDVLELNRELQHEREVGGTQHNDLRTQLRNSMREAPSHPLVKDVNRLVRDLTGGEYVAVEFPANRRDLVAISESKESFSSDILSRPTRDLLQAALAMAVANHNVRLGKVRPLVLNDAFQHVPAPRLRACIDLLQDFTRGPHQVILLTTHNSVLSLAKSLGICCYDWDQQVQATVETTRGHTYDTAWDCEEFPGELRDRTSDAILADLHRDSTRQTNRSREDYATPDYDRQSYRNVDYTTRADQPSTDRRDRSGTVHSSTNRSSTNRLHADVGAIDYTTNYSSEYADANETPEETLRVTGHYLELSDRVTEISFIPRRISSAMTEHGVWTVANLFHADPLLLAERLHHHDVSAAEIRQWQAQARLMCAVRKMRSYDARILVGCGITTPNQLEELHPQEVSRMVEAFVATADGSQIVRSGTTVEIERVTRWIRSLQRRNSSLLGDGDSSQSDERPERTARRATSPRTTRSQTSTSNSTSNSTSKGASQSGNGNGLGTTQTNEASESQKSGRESKSRSGRRSRSSRSERQTGSTRQTRSSRNGSFDETESSEPTPRRTTRRATRRSGRSSESGRQSGVLPMKFHLETSSHVEAAPTIGPRMAERLEAIGIVTVADLFAADAADVAARLDHRRTTAEIVTQWQRQAELVCRVPQIRGHDAQILVACEITSPEHIATFEPNDLLAIVDPLCNGPDGKRLLRNNKRPDLAEVTEWIEWAKRARQISDAA